MTEPGSNSATPVLVLRKIRQILRAFSIEDPELSLHQITRATGLPASTCQRLVRNLVLEGFLDRDGDRYRIGLEFVQWAAPGTFGLDLVALTRPSLQKLRDDTGETACLYLRHGPFRTVVSLAESRHPIIRLFVLGMVMPLHAGSAGKVLLAWDPAARQDAVGHGLTRFTPDTVVDIDVLTGQLSAIREAGYAASFEERDVGAASISAPVFGIDGDVVAALGIGAPTQRLTPADLPRLAPVVVQAAWDASQRLGWRHSKD
ncbi:IclR family transcriptional regulator [Pseudonocardia spinosispora]|uniref:IclR family transcriptional regulator n=1 Tax=Pseudonocardia spinosispora TaxID=103441 RepID=UPI000413A97E|nr:IclR family transcriptional regulator [Pseudonocardia spinosispora]